MARCLIVGCGCRGRALAGKLTDAGHVVRGTTRDRSQMMAIEGCGAEAVVADPDRIATVVPLLGQVSVVVLLLGSAAGSRQEVAALHSTRLAMLLSKLTDTTVRGVVYEATGTVEPRVLEAGTALVMGFAERTHGRCEILTADPGSVQNWLAAALNAVEAVLAPR